MKGGLVYEEVMFEVLTFFGEFHAIVTLLFPIYVLYSCLQLFLVFLKLHVTSYSCFVYFLFILLAFSNQGKEYYY